MSVRNCVFPWHWALITNDGEVLPCSHGAGPVGDLRRQSMAEIWNGPLIQELRASILRDEVHPLCVCETCPHQQSDPAFPHGIAPLTIESDFAQHFDEAWYLAAHPDAREAVEERRFVSGLEHFIRHGRLEGRAYRVCSESAPLDNAVRGLLEYAEGRTFLTARPIDLILAVTTICNLSCVMCPHGMALVDRPRHMAVSIVESLEDFLWSAARMIVSGLGEPTVAPAFWKILEHSRQRHDLFIRVNSNGHLLTVERARLMLTSGLREISFSLDAATAATYTKIRGGDFHRALRGVALLVAERNATEGSRLEICINMTLMRENLPELPAFVRLARELGVDAVIVTQLFVFGDRPDWQVSRGEWTFVYSEQMIHRFPAEAAHHLRQAQEASAALRVPLRFHCNVASYVLPQESLVPSTNPLASTEV